MRFNPLIATVLALVVVGMLQAMSEAAAPGSLEEEQQQQQQVAGADRRDGTTALKRSNFELPKLFDFESYKRLYKKSYSGLLENMMRAKLFMSRAFRAVISAIKFMYREERFHLALNHMSDNSQEELDMMRNKALEEYNAALEAQLDSHQKQQQQQQQQSKMVADENDHSLPDFIPDDDDDGNAIEILRKVLDEHRGEPVFEKMRAQLEEVHEARRQGAASEQQRRRRKRDTAMRAGGEGVVGVSAAPPPPRALSLEKLINPPPPRDTSEANALLSAETRAKIRERPTSNNPLYEGIELPTQGLRDQQVRLRRVVVSARSPLLRLTDELSMSLDRLRMKYLGVGLAAETEPPARLDDEVFLDLRETSSCFFAPRGQGHCGSCYAFAATTVAEWLHCNVTGELVAFSEQYAVDCGKEFAPTEIMGCGGGWIDKMGKFFHNFGFELQKNYPYATAEQRCPYPEDTDLPTTGFIRADMRKSVLFEIEAWPEALRDYGPLAVNIDTGKGFSEYGSGVYTDCKPKPGGHSVVLIGHGREDGEEYWLIRNSYTAGWGEAGHLKLSKKADCVQPRVGFTFGSDDGRKVNLKPYKNKANEQIRITTLPVLA